MENNHSIETSYCMLSAHMAFVPIPSSSGATQWQMGWHCGMSDNYSSAVSCQLKTGRRIILEVHFCWFPVCVTNVNIRKPAQPLPGGN